MCDVADARVERCVHSLHRGEITAAIRVRVQGEPPPGVAHLVERGRPRQAEHGERIVAGRRAPIGHDDDAVAAAIECSRTSA